MNKKVFLGAAVVSAVAMMCGFDNTKSADEILALSQEAAQSATDMSMTMNLGLDVAMQMGSSTLGLTASGDITADAVLEPFAVGMEGKMTMEAMGQQMSMDLASYAVTDENGQLVSYSYTDDNAEDNLPGVWSKSVAEGVNIKELMEMAQGQNVNYADYGIIWEVAPASEVQNGKECYVVSTTITSDTLLTLLQKVGEEQGQVLPEDVTSALGLLSGLQLNLVQCIDVESYLPVAMHMDMNGSDFSLISALIAESMVQQGAQDGSAPEININNLSFDYLIDYNTGVTVTVPAEALAAN